LFGVWDLYLNNQNKQICLKNELKKKTKMSLKISKAPNKRRSLSSCRFKNKLKQTETNQNNTSQNEKNAL